MPKTTRKTTAKTKATKPAKKAPSTQIVAKKKITISEPFTKSQVFAFLAETSGLKKKDVTNLMSALAVLMEMHLGGKRAPGEFVSTWPDEMPCRQKTCN